MEYALELESGQDYPGHCPSVTSGRPGYFAVTREWVMACTESAIRFCTPTLRISLAKCAFTVRSSIPRADPISLLERPATNISRTSFSRSVKLTRPLGKMRPGEELTRSINIES